MLLFPHEYVSIFKNGDLAQFWVSFTKYVPFIFQIGFSISQRLHPCMGCSQSFQTTAIPRTWNPLSSPTISGRSFPGPGLEKDSNPWLAVISCHEWPTTHGWRSYSCLPIQKQLQRMFDGNGSNISACSSYWNICIVCIFTAYFTLFWLKCNIENVSSQQRSKRHSLLNFLKLCDFQNFKNVLVMYYNREDSSR